MIKKLRFEGLTLVMLNDKILLCPKERKSHYTFHFGPRSGKFDVHLTTRLGERKRHRTLVMMSHDEAFKAILSIGRSLLLDLAREYRTLSLDWVIHQGLEAVIIRNVGESEWEKYLVRKGGSHQLDLKAVEADLRLAESPADLLDLDNDELFYLYSTKMQNRPKLVGVGHLSRGPSGLSKLVWVPVRSLNRAIRGAQAAFEKLLNGT